MKKRIFSVVLIMLILIQCIAAIPFTASAADSKTYTLVTDASELEAGGQYLIVCQSKNMAMGAQNGSYRAGVEVTINNNEITTADAQIITLGGVAGAWTLAVSDTEYLYWDSGNSVETGETAYEWTIDIGLNDDEKTIATITTNVDSTRKLKWNAGSPRFACYTSAQTDIQLFKYVPGAHEHSYSWNGQAGMDGSHTLACSNIDGKCGVTTITEECTWVEGYCSVCNAKAPESINLPTIAISREAFGDDTEYAWHSWTAVASTGESISGSGFIYGNTKNSIQVNGSKDGDYIYNTTALPGKIVSVTLTKATGTDRNFDVLTSDTPFDSATTASLKSQATDAKKLVTTNGVTWEFTTDHKYFAIVIVDKKAAYLSSIEIAYKAEEGENPTGDINGDGKVNIIDLLKLKMIIADIAADSSENADLDGSGTVDEQDLVKLRQMLLGVI